MRKLFFVLSVCAISFPVAQAGSIVDRTTLVSLLGGPGVTENFEAFSVGSESSTGMSCAVLNASAVCNEQGPGLVVGGVNFTFGSGGGQWDGPGYFGSTSKELLSGAPAGQPLTIDFTSGVTAFGVDLRAFSTFGATAALSVYASDDTTLIGTLPGIGLSADGALVFAGWSDAAGIGMVQLTQAGQPWSPIIDNLEFGEAGNQTPEPATGMLFVAGFACLAIRRKLAR